MTLPTRPTVSLLSIADDPTLGTTPERGRDDRRHQICFLAEALAQKGWQVDLFTGQAQTHLPSTAWLVPHCRVIRLPIQPNETLAPQVAQGIQTFQTKDGLLSPLFHSLDRHSAQVGAYLKQHRGWRWLHTRWPDEIQHQNLVAYHPTTQSPDQLLVWRFEGDWIDPILTDEVSQMRYQRHLASQKDNQATWEQIADWLSGVYRQHLAAHVGAVGLEIPPVSYLPLPLSPRKSADSRWAAHSLEQYSTPQYSYSA